MLFHRLVYGLSKSWFPFLFKSDKRSGLRNVFVQNAAMGLLQQNILIVLVNIVTIMYLKNWIQIPGLKNYAAKMQQALLTNWSAFVTKKAFKNVLCIKRNRKNVLVSKLNFAVILFDCR